MQAMINSTEKSVGFLISDIIDEYAVILWENDNSRLTNKKFLDRISSIKPEKFNEISRNDLIVISSQLLEMGFKPSTVNRHMSALTKLLRHAQENGLIPNVPVFNQLHDNSDQLRYLTSAEQTELFYYIDKSEPYYCLLSTFLVETGATLGEATGLYWENFIDCDVIIPTNTKNEGRRLPLTIRAKAAIKEASAESSGPFRRVSQQTYRRVWNIALEDADIENKAQIVPTVLRHTCASRLIISGMDMRLVQKWLGNKNYQSMIRYEQLINLTNFRGCCEALDSYYE